MTHTLEIHNFEPTDPRLARHVTHDSRSWDHQFLAVDAKPKKIDTFWKSSTGPLNQGQVGSCTGNASAQWFNSDFAKAVRDLIVSGKLGSWTVDKKNKDGFFDEGDAVHIYSAGTRKDRIRGVYPPNDTGCSGLGVAKACEGFGLISAYSHTFSFNSFQAALEITPAIVGTIWTNDMFKPVNGLVKVGKLVDSNVAGGHEYHAAGIEFTNEVFVFRNSWGDQDEWPGCKPGGYFAIGFDDMATLLDNQGDVTIFHGAGM
jgi:hypothetical protein